VDTSANSSVLGVQRLINPIIQGHFGTQLISISPSGSFAKGSANNSGTDIDLFVSLSSTVATSLKDIYNSVFNLLTTKGYQSRKQNVSIGIKVAGYDVDVVPAKRQDSFSQDHSLYRRKADTWTKTNVATHINQIRNSGRLEEIRVIKLWRNQKGLDFSSFYLELTVIDALYGKPIGNLSNNVWEVFLYLRDKFSNARVVDPANTNNIISDDLTIAEKNIIVAAARSACLATNWNQIII
jgi:hypothetical protein